MAYGCKTQGLLAALNLFASVPSCFGGDGAGMEKCNNCNSISEFSEIISENRVPYIEFREKFSRFGPISLDDRSRTLYIDYKNLGKCYPIDNRDDVLPGGTKNIFIDKFQCRVGYENNLTLADVNGMFGEAYHVRTPLHAAGPYENFNPRHGDKLYTLGFQNPAAKGVFVEIVVATKNDLVSLSRDAGKFPVLPSKEILKYGHDIQVVMIKFSIDD